jgi:DNA-binding NtrC family response regulator
MTATIDVRERLSDLRVWPEMSAGIAFGSSKPSFLRSDKMPAPLSHMEHERPNFIARQRDRRSGLGHILAILSRSIGDTSDLAPLRGAFEETTRRVVPVRAVRLRDANARWIDRAGPVDAVESLVLPVAGGTLEAFFDPGTPLGDWDFQILGDAAHLAALVLEIERNRLQLARAGLVPGCQPKRDGAAPLIGSTPAMMALRDRIERLASTDFTVLLEGESGVGKELVARQIHELSRRRNGPFVAINCAALVETLLEAELFGIEERTATGVRGRRGKFEHADGGTLFLDEVSDLSLSAQAKLLRVIQDLAVERVGGNGTRRVDIRIVAATNRRLATMVERQLFRSDLFYRLSGVDIRVPALRERRDDILELAQYFIDRHRNGRPLRLSASAADALLSHSWPGNVRELERLIEGALAVATADVIELDDLPPTVRVGYAEAILPSLMRNESMRAWASRYAKAVLDRCQGNKRAAARALSISYHTLIAHLKYPAHEPVLERVSATPGISGSTGERDEAGVAPARSRGRLGDSDGE